jgi:hypothetical protein
MTDALDLFELSGDAFDTLLSFSFHPETDLASWRIPIHFAGPTRRLLSPFPGPSGLFSVLQASILLNDRLPTKSAHLLIDAVLDVMSQMRGGRSFIFCQIFDLEHKHLLFLTTPDRDTARTFLIESGYLQTQIAALLLALSFVCLAGAAMLSNSATRDPLICRDGSTSARFVLLLISGLAADYPGQDFKVDGLALCSGVMIRQVIGYLIERDGENQAVVGDALAKPEEPIWVRDLGSRFDVITWEGGQLLAFDPLDCTECEYRTIERRRSSTLRRRSE